MKLERVLCAADFSEFAADALNYSVSIARRLQCRLYVFHSICFPRHPLYGIPTSKNSESGKQRLKSAEMRLKKFMAPYDIQWSPVIGFGDPVEEVSNVIRDRQIDLVVTAGHGISGIRRMIIGTVVERMSRTLNRPVLCVRKKRKRSEHQPLTPEFKNIIVGCNFSSDAAGALLYAVELALRFDSTLHAVHSIETPFDEELIRTTRGSYTELEQAKKERLNRKILDLIPETFRNKVNLEISLLQGVPGEGLVNYAHDNQGDLVIVGVRHHGGLSKILIGSSTEYVLRHATLPVLTVPSSIEADEETG